MKKIASILLLGILFFNWIGFRIYSAYQEQKASVQLEASIDENNYDESQLISIKVPAEHLSSYALSKQFQRVDGQVEVNGIQYKYVKRRVFNDSLELLCIPNQQGMQVKNAREDFFKLVNDLQHNGQGKKAASHSGTSKNFSVDYYTAIDQFFYANNGTAVVSATTCHYSENLSSIYSPTAEHPPEHC